MINLLRCCFSTCSSSIKSS